MLISIVNSPLAGTGHLALEDVDAFGRTRQLRLLAVDDHRYHVVGRHERAGQLARTACIVIGENRERNTLLVRFRKFQLLDTLVGLHLAATGFEQCEEFGGGSFVVVAVEDVTVGYRVGVGCDLSREDQRAVGTLVEARLDQRRCEGRRETREGRRRDPLAGSIESDHGEEVFHLGHQAGQRLLEGSFGHFTALLDESETVDGVVGRILEVGDRRRFDDHVGSHVFLFGHQFDLRGARSHVIHVDRNGSRNGSVVDIVAFARRYGECRQKTSRRP